MRRLCHKVDFIIPYTQLTPLKVGLNGWENLNALMENVSFEIVHFVDQHSISITYNDELHDMICGNGIT